MRPENISVILKNFQIYPIFCFWEGCVTFYWRVPQQCSPNWIKTIKIVKIDYGRIGKVRLPWIQNRNGSNLKSIRLIDNFIALSSAESYSQGSVKLKILGIFNQICLKCIPVVCIPIQGPNSGVNLESEFATVLCSGLILYCL